MPTQGVSEKCSIVITAVARGDGSDGGWVTVGDESRMATLDNYEFSGVPYSMVAQYAYGYEAACKRFVRRPDGSPAPVRVEVTDPQVAKREEFKAVRIFCPGCHREVTDTAKFSCLRVDSAGLMLDVIPCEQCAPSAGDSPS